MTLPNQSNQRIASNILVVLSTSIHICLQMYSPNDSTEIVIFFLATGIDYDLGVPHPEYAGARYRMGKKLCVVSSILFVIILIVSRDRLLAKIPEPIRSLYCTFAVQKLVSRIHSRKECGKSNCVKHHCGIFCLNQYLLEYLCSQCSTRGSCSLSVVFGG